MMIRLIARIIIFCMPTLCFSGNAYSQDFEIRGTFLQDSTRIGEPVPYALSFRYPSEWQVVFPDSLYNYFPFEFVDKTYFPTRSIGGISVDSAVYQLTTFELDSLAPLALPVFIVDDGDSAAIFAQRDTLFLQATITQLPDSVALKEDARFREVDVAFNYPYLIIGLLVFVAIVVVVWIFFGRTISNRIKLYRLRKDYQTFTARFDRIINQNGQSPKQAEAAVIEWKKYLEKLENKPYTKLTSKEILQAHRDASLEKALRAIDRSIYGGIDDDRLKEDLYRLMDYSVDRYNEKVEELKYGR